jgi:hypothetical protein
MRPEPHDLLQRRREITPEADRPVVHEDVGGRLLVRHLGDPAVEAVRGEPGLSIVRPAAGEDDHPESPLVQLPQEISGTRARRVPVLLVLPAGIAVEHAVEVDTDDGARIAHGRDFPTP